MVGDLVQQQANLKRRLTRLREKATRELQKDDPSPHYLATDWRDVKLLSQVVNVRQEAIRDILELEAGEEKLQQLDEWEMKFDKELEVLRDARAFLVVRNPVLLATCEKEMASQGAPVVPVCQSDTQRSPQASALGVNNTSARSDCDVSPGASRSLVAPQGKDDGEVGTLGVCSPSQAVAVGGCPIDTPSMVSSGDWSQCTFNQYTSCKGAHSTASASPWWPGSWTRSTSIFCQLPDSELSRLWQFF